METVLIVDSEPRKKPKRDSEGLDRSETATELARNSEFKKIADLQAGPVPVWKHLLDLLFIFLTFPVWLPLMLLIALGIKIVSRGPVIFRQERIGYGNKPFTCLKFRSMRVDADAKAHSQHMAELISKDAPMVKMDSGDTRLIAFGALLRSTGLDELPQFVNVMRRDMSLVGPRPCTLSEYERYSSFEKERFNTLPGLTGLWQVSGKNRTTFTQMMNLDLHYVRNKTIWMDLGIILKTLPAILTQVQDIQDHKGASQNVPPSRAGFNVRTFKSKLLKTPYSQN